VSGPWTVGRIDKTDERPCHAIPDHVEYVPHPEYLCRGTERELFGPSAHSIRVPRWRPPLETGDGQQEVQRPQAGPSLSRQDEVLLFRRYNCARYHLANLMEKQKRRFTRSRVPEMRGWHRRVMDNRAALAQANMALVVAMAKRMRASSLEFGELVSEGNMALLRAVDKFDFSRGFKFSTYACSAILKAFARLAAKARTYRRRFPTGFEPQMERSDETERRHADQHELALEDLRRVLALNRGGLTEVEQRVLWARFAVVGDGRVETLHKERGRQVLNRALAKLRQAMELRFSPATTG